MKNVLSENEVQDVEALFHEDDRTILHQVGRLQSALVRLQYEGKFSFGKNLKEIQEIVDFFEQEVKGHMDEEERVLFPFLKAHLPRLDPLLALLCSEHQDFKEALVRFKRRLADLERNKDGGDRTSLVLIDQLREIGTYLICLLQSHHREESEILYKVADRELREDEKEELAKRLSKERKETLK